MKPKLNIVRQTEDQRYGLPDRRIESQQASGWIVVCIIISFVMLGIVMLLAATVA